MRPSTRSTISNDRDRTNALPTLSRPGQGPVAPKIARTKAHRAQVRKPALNDRFIVFARFLRRPDGRREQLLTEKISAGGFHGFFVSHLPSDRPHSLNRNFPPFVCHPQTKRHVRAVCRAGYLDRNLELQSPSSYHLSDYLPPVHLLDSLYNQYYTPISPDDNTDVLPRGVVREIFPSTVYVYTECSLIHLIISRTICFLGENADLRTR